MNLHMLTQSFIEFHNIVHEWNKTPSFSLLRERGQIGISNAKISMDKPQGRIRGKICSHLGNVGSTSGEALVRLLGKGG